MIEYQHMADAHDYSLGRPGRKKDGGDGSGAASGAVSSKPSAPSSPPGLSVAPSWPLAPAALAACAPMGLHGLLGHAGCAAAAATTWPAAKPGNHERPSPEDYCILDLKPAPALPRQPLPWDDWDSYLDDLEQQVEAQAMAYKQATANFNHQVAGVIAKGLVGSGGCGGSDASIADVAVKAGGGMIAAAVRSRGSAKRRLILALPTVPYISVQRPKLGRRLPIPACMAKPVSRKVQLSSLLARAAMDAEWDGLRKLGTWDEVVFREWADVAREAQLVIPLA